MSTYALVHKCILQHIFAESYWFHAASIEPISCEEIAIQGRKY